MSFHQTIIEGNVGQGPEMRYTTNGTAVANCSVAVNEKYGDKETTTWYRVTFWDKLAETAGQYLTKGKEILIVGRMQSRKYTDKDGVERTAWELVARDMRFVGKRDSDGGSGGSGGRYDIDPDDLPFEN